MRWRRTILFLSLAASSPSIVSAWRCSSWMRSRLLAVLVDGEDEAAVQKLFVDDGGRRRQEDLDRPLDAVFLRDEPAGVRVFPRRRDRQLAFRLEELQRVAGALGSLLLDDGEDLVAQALLLGEVEERHAGQRRVLLALFLGHEIQDGFHQARLPRGRAGLEDHGERPVELAGGGGQVADEFVRLLAHDAAAGEVVEDAVEEIRVSQEPHRLLGVLCVHEDGARFRLERLRDRFLLQLLGAPEHRAQVVLDHALLDAQLERRLALEDGARTSRIEIEGVDEEARERRLLVEEAAVARDEDVQTQEP